VHATPVLLRGTARGRRRPHYGGIRRWDKVQLIYTFLRDIFAPYVALCVKLHYYLLVDKLFGPHTSTAGPEPIFDPRGTSVALDGGLVYTTGSKNWSSTFSDEFELEAAGRRADLAAFNARTHDAAALSLLFAFEDRNLPSGGVRRGHDHDQQADGSGVLPRIGNDSALAAAASTPGADPTRGLLSDGARGSSATHPRSPTSSTVAAEAVQDARGQLVSHPLVLLARVLNHELARHIGPPQSADAGAPAAAAADEAEEWERRWIESMEWWPQLRDAIRMLEVWVERDARARELAWMRGGRERDGLIEVLSRRKEEETGRRTPTPTRGTRRRFWTRWRPLLRPVPVRAVQLWVAVAVWPFKLGWRSTGWMRSEVRRAMRWVSG
jgi:hypothetical protein